MNNNLRLFSTTTLIFAFLLQSRLAAQSKTVEDVLWNVNKVQLNGYIGRKLDLAYQNRILAQDAKRLSDVFKTKKETWCWQSEFWGKWFTSAVLAYKYMPVEQLKSLLDHSVQSLLVNQTADGYIGNYSEEKRLEQWDIWGMKYSMLGLLSYFELTADKMSLLAASKLADYLINELQRKHALIVKKGNHRGMAASSVLEPTILLYNITKNIKYLEFAGEMVKQWETEEGPQLISKSSIPVAQRFPKPESWFGWEQGQKAYEMMSCYEGLLELYRVTGNEKYKRAVENTWQSIMNSEINIAGSGSSIECWFGGKNLQAFPAKHYQETCVTATWIKLSIQLLRLTGEAKYADAIEISFYNALLGSMTEDGSKWSKYTPLEGHRLEGEDQCGMGINCCIASGPRGLFSIPFIAVMSKQAGLNVNLYIDGAFQLKSPGGQDLNVLIRTEYPAVGDVLIQPGVSKPETFEISLRVPEWSLRSLVVVNNDTIQNIGPGRFISLKRNWKATDRIKLMFDMRGRIYRTGQLPEYMAIMSGPVVLATDKRLHESDLSSIIRPVTDSEGYIELRKVKSKVPHIWIEYFAEFAMETTKANLDTTKHIALCDYASAGKTYNDSSSFRVWFEQFVNAKE
ncbi:beta-L-arabinofuranosidase domain-containing protein [Paraflavitalea speifideaquila]|uniref:beta-L-arabinofuranosidase domain-containing protein n=1 Tax=Paraflavitalea speifideaquila TaxID=3076558 RepID=UPI0028E82E42|nr:beta-L-arabinofuranosidase domain-containing protein [Paraflavitalea speifideiaquila]